MKAIFYLPAHPSYFDDEYTQEEIERAIVVLDRMNGGTIFKGNQRTKVKHKFVLLRVPGKSVTVAFDSTGIADGQTGAENSKQHGIEQYRRSSNHDLQIHVGNLKSIMDGIRNGITYE